MKLKSFKEKDKKKMGILLFIIFCILLITGVILFRTFAIFNVSDNFNLIHGTIEEVGDIYFAFYKDGVIQKEMPLKKSGYILDEEKSYCGVLGQKDESIKPILNQEDWSITVQGVTTSRTKCNLYFRNYYKVNVNGKEYQVNTSTNQTAINKKGNILLCNNGIKIKEENEVQLNNITKDSICNFYDTSNEAIENMDNSEDYIIFLNDEKKEEKIDIKENSNLTIDLNGHTKNGKITNAGVLFLKSSNKEKGVMQILQGTLLNTLKNSYTEIENIVLENNNGHAVIAGDNSYIKIIDSKLKSTTSSYNTSGIFTSELGNLEIKNSEIEAPYGIGGNGGNIVIKDSNITATSLVGIQTNVGKEGNVTIDGSTTITAKTYGILIFQGSLKINGSIDAFPRIESLKEVGLRLDYGILNYQYGEIYGKQPNDIKGAILTRKGTTLTTETQNGKYYTYLK